MNTNFHKLALALPLILASTDLVSAQIRTRVSARTANFTRDVGNSQNGINVRMNGRVESRITSVGNFPISGRFRADGQVTGRVRVFGTDREAVRVTGFGQVAGSLRSFGASASYGAGYTVRIGGNTVSTRSYSGATNIVLRMRRNYNNPTILSKSVSIPTPLGIPVNLSVQAGANASLALDVTLRPTLLIAQLTGFATGVATGRASASVSLLCASAGVTTDLRLLNTRLTPSMTASRRGLSGRLGYDVRAVRIMANVFANLCGFNWSQRILDLSFGRLTGSRTLSF
jgi:hypothetical protein